MDETYLVFGGQLFSFIFFFVNLNLSAFTIDQQKPNTMPPLDDVLRMCRVVHGDFV